MGALTINGTSGVDTFNVGGTATGVPTTINAGSGLDVFGPINLTSIGNAGLTINGNSGGATNGESLTLNATSAGTISVLNTQVVRTGNGAVTYGGIASLTVNGTTGVDTFNIVSTAAGTVTSVSAGAGLDQFGIIDLIQIGTAGLSINGGANGESFAVNYGNSGSVTANSTSVQLAGHGAISYTGTALILYTAYTGAFSVFDGRDGDWINVSTTAGATKYVTVGINGINRSFGNALASDVALLSIICGDGGQLVDLSSCSVTEFTRQGAGTLVYGGNGNDFILGSDLSDAIYGDDGADTIYGYAGDDGLSAGSGVGDFIDGGAGWDAIDGSSQGFSYLIGGDDDDVIVASGTSNTLDGGSGNDILYGGSGSDFLADGPGNDQVYSRGGDDLFYGGGGEDYFYAGPGNNHYTLSNVVGDVYIFDDEGNDVLDFNSDSRYLNIDLTQLSQAVTSDLNLTLSKWTSGVAQIESVDGGNGGNWIIGNDLNNFLSGGSWYDHFEGGDGFHAGDSVTHMACRTEFPGYFEAVFAHKGDPALVKNGAITGDTPIFSVITGVAADKMSKIKLLIDKGADLDHMNGEWLTPTMDAVSWGAQFDIALVLLKAGANHRIYMPKSNRKLIHLVAMQDDDRRPMWSSQQEADYQTLIKWLEDHGESIESARADIKRWQSYNTTPQEYRRKMDAEIAERVAKEKVTKEQKK
jgi:Ca2+-binding RTX toxin-like protein